MEALPEQSKEEWKTQQKSYKKVGRQLWVQRFLKDADYKIVDNEGDGDCFFSTIRDGLCRSNINRSVHSLRKMLSENITDEIYQIYKDRYETLIVELTNLQELLNENNSNYKSLGAAAKQNRGDHDKLTSLIRAGERLKEVKEGLQLMKDQLEEDLEGYGFMSNISSLDELKNFIMKTCVYRKNKRVMKRGAGNCYWADEVAIAILEKILNIKLIILSSEYFKYNDLANVLQDDVRLQRVIQCGLNFDDINIKKDKEREDSDMLYIITDYMGNHYKLVTYKNHGAMKFAKVPYGIKRLILDRCFEGETGAFRGIQEIEDLYENYKSQSVSANEEEVKKEELQDPEWTCEQCTLLNNPQNDTCNLCSADKPLKAKPDVDERLEQVNEMNVTGIDRDSLLSNPNTIFKFYYRSSPHPAPGHGSGETIDDNSGYKSQFTALPHNWRQMLSDEFTHPFAYDNNQWYSIHHYALAQKYKDVDPEKFEQFTLDSDSDISSDIRLAKKTAGRYTYDVDLSGPLMSKFGDKELKSVLLNTGDATLLEYIPKRASRLRKDLMSIRNKLIKDKIVKIPVPTLEPRVTSAPARLTTQVSPTTADTLEPLASKMRKTRSSRSLTSLRRTQKRAPQSAEDKTSLVAITEA